MGLRKWLGEHTAEDVERARVGERAVVFAVTKNVTVGRCLEAFAKYRIQNLMIYDEGEISWLRLRDVIEWHTQDPRRENRSCWEVARRGGKECGLEDTILTLLSLWDDDDWLDPIILKNHLVNVAGVITSADVLHYLYVYGYHLKSIIELPAMELDWEPNPPLLSNNTKAIDCLRALLEPSSPGVVGLVDRRGLLVGSVTLENFIYPQDVLELPINLYLEDDGSSPPSLLTYSEKLTCGDVLRKILQHQTHYVWRLDSFARPVGVLNLRNLITFLKRSACR